MEFVRRAAVKRLVRKEKEKVRLRLQKKKLPTKIARQSISGQGIA